jgi:hypothetical protein
MNYDCDKCKMSGYCDVEPEGRHYKKTSKCVMCFDYIPIGDDKLSKDDMWAHRASGMVCSTCMWFLKKAGKIENFGRCRKHSPTMGGFPAVYGNDWCGDHKLNENI